MKQKKYKVKKLSPDKLKESGGKVATEDMFTRDMRMAKLFIGYMIRNIKYMKRYESDISRHDKIRNELSSIQLKLSAIDSCFNDIKENK